MPSLRDKAVFFPPNTFDGKDKSLTRSHWQSFEDFLEHQELQKPTTQAEVDTIVSFFSNDIMRLGTSMANF